MISAAFLGHRHKRNQGRGAPAQRSLLPFTIWKLFLSSVGKEVVIYFEVLSHLLPKFFPAHVLFCRVLCSRLANTLNFVLNHLLKLKNSSGFSVLKVSLRSLWMAREPIFKNPPWRILCLAYEPAFGTTGLNFQLPAGRETSCDFFPWALPWAHC